MVSKYFEIIYNKSVLVSDKIMIPILNNIGLFENYHFLTIDINNIKSDLESIKNYDKDKAIKMAENAYKVISNNHSLKSRVEFIDYIFLY